jgi:outer membrane protein OmpA-like peptidoglycan-associated protein
MRTTMRSRTRAALALLAGLIAAPALADGLSTSIMRPTALDPTSGLVTGKMPGGQGATSYYLSVDLQAGELVTQLQVTGTPNTAKRLDLELLDSNARVAHSVYVMAGLDAKNDTMRSFPVDRAGRYVIRLVVDGKESGTYCALLGGTALPSAHAPGCPTPAPAVVAAPPPPVVAPPPPVVAPPPAVVPPPPPPPKAVEVIVSKCEERLRVGSDFLFDFDRAEVRSEAAPALAELAERITAADRPVLIEGHTDGKGTESYNQRLSERRAGSVRTALVDRGLRPARLNVRGFGKSRPVAPNEKPDGSDDPDGRQKNRRVEVVINTCS